MPIPLQNGIIYGPVRSRRFGASLGINLLPADAKVCSMSCVYCQYEDTQASSAVHFPLLEEIERALQEALADFKKSPAYDWLMICGNGEPTLYPFFDEAVNRILKIRDELAPGLKVGILSNSITCERFEIRQALLKLDGRYMKLDAGKSEFFLKVNRVARSSAWTNVIYGLSRLPNIVLQSMFVRGAVDNTSEQEIDDWIEAVRYIQPLRVQVYTVERPPQEDRILPVSSEKLEQIAERLTLKTKIPASVFLPNE